MVQFLAKMRAGRIKEEKARLVLEALAQDRKRFGYEIQQKDLIKLVREKKLDIPKSLVRKIWKEKHSVQQDLKSKDSQIQNFVQNEILKGNLPRQSDFLRLAKKSGLNVSRNDLRSVLLRHPVYMFNMNQQRKRLRSKREQPIVTNCLGNLHADVLKFQLSSEYETPVRYQSGVLVAKDVLSRYVYAVILEGSKDASAFIKAFKELLHRHRGAGHKHLIKSISFDKEPSVMGKEVQAFLKSHNISFHAFKMSSSKAKHAENANGLIRKQIARLERKQYMEYEEAKQRGKLPLPKIQRWWRLLDEAVVILNNREVLIGEKSTGFTPSDVNVDNVEKFCDAIYIANHHLKATQFSIDPSHVKFKYSVGDQVRAKLIATSSAAIGEKRSETNLEKDVYIIESLRPYLSAKGRVEKSYVCKNIETDETEKYDESDIALTDSKATTYNRHIQSFPTPTRMLLRSQK